MDHLKGELAKLPAPGIWRIHWLRWEKGFWLLILNRSPSSRQLKKYKFFLPVEIYLLAVFMQLASKFHVFPLALREYETFSVK